MSYEGFGFFRANCKGFIRTVYKFYYCINVLMMFYYLFSAFFSIVKGQGMGISCINSLKLFTVNIWLFCKLM